MVLVLNVRQGRKSSIRRLEALPVDRAGPAVERILLLDEALRMNFQNFLMTTRFNLREMRYVEFIV